IQVWGVNGVAVALGNQRDPLAVADGFGGAYVIWTENPGANDILGTHLSSTGGIIASYTVTNDPGVQYEKVLTADTNHGAFVGFLDTGSQKILAQHIVTGAIDPTWPVGGLAISPSSGSRTMSSIVSDGSGGAIAAWYESRLGTEDIYATRVTAAGV